MKFYVQTTLLEKKTFGTFTGKNKRFFSLLKIRKEYLYIRVKLYCEEVPRAEESAACVYELPVHTSSLDSLPL